MVPGYLCLALGLLLLPLSAAATSDDVPLDKGIFEGRVGVGYRSVTSVTGEPARATEYTLLETGPVGEAEIVYWRQNSGFNLRAGYLNDSDYSAEGELNYRSRVRLHFRTESLYHNLDHLPFDLHARQAGENEVLFEDLDPGEDYALEVERSAAGLKIKAGNYPAHVNLDYWRLDRTGQEQLRFADHGQDSAGSCSSCHVRSQTREVDRVTEEVSGSIDAHLGYVDLVAEQVYREFRDKEPIPEDFFQSPWMRTGSFQHDEDPDSKMVATTLKAHTSLSGGVVGAASFTIGKRENRSDLADVRPVDVETDFRKGAADLTWVPAPRWTFNFRYRHLDLDHSNPDQIISDSNSNPISVRDNVDLTRATYAARVSYRPGKRWTLKGDYERKEIDRGNTGPANIEEVSWYLPDEEVIDRFKVTLLGRPLGSGKLRMRTWYEYLTSDDPAYGASAEESHQAFAGLTWTPVTTAGLNIGLKGLKQENENHQFVQKSRNPWPASATLFAFEEDRQQEKTDVTAGFWWTPLEVLSVTVNYGYFRTELEQDFVFGSQPSQGYFIQDEKLEYSQEVHTASAGMTWRIDELLQARLEGRYNDSYAAWDPDFSAEVPPAGSGEFVDSSALQEISEIDLRQYGVSFGVDWSPVEDWRWSARYTYDDYDDRETDIFDGTAQTLMASVSRAW